MLNDIFFFQNRKTYLFLNIVLCLILLFIYIGGMVLFHRININLNERAIIVSSVSNTVNTGNKLNSLDFYLHLVLSANIFKRYNLPKKNVVKLKTIDDLTKDYMLIGVVATGRKEAILKNRRTRKTIFVKEGMSIGDLQVLKINDDKIELEYDGSIKDLYLT